MREFRQTWPDGRRESMGEALRRRSLNFRARNVDPSQHLSHQQLTQFRQRLAGVVVEPAIEPFLKRQVVLYERAKPTDSRRRDDLGTSISRVISGFESPVAS